MGERRSSRTGQETRDRIIDAVLTTVSNEGLVGTSARVIARTGGFNQALVFYHFGSVEDLLLAALERANERRMNRFRERLEEVEDLRALVQVAIDLHASAEDCDHMALTAIVAGWSASSDLGPRILEILRPWDDMVADALRRSLAGTPFGQVVPTEDMAHAISALFLGIELISRLDADDKRTDSLLSSLAGAANLAGPLLDAMAADPADS
ncbi:MAG: TetR/AcrR family transcriptional regulator [Acidimicrobiia bacterium]|nr:TetR/AcrR family transcriptional regulator [Acidimicrobiia bacterium]